jgi:glycosyltransferase involved in cell wall biosynthesis
MPQMLASCSEDCVTTQAGSPMAQGIAASTSSAGIGFIIRYRYRDMDNKSGRPPTRPGSAIRMLTVTLPVYNEEAAIEHVVLEHVAVLNRVASDVPEWEIVCVDDGSNDRTPEILRDLQTRIPRLRVIRQENRGIFGAFTRAYQEARGSHIFVTGSDGQWPAENLETLLPFLLSGVEVVVGVRTNRKHVYSPARRVISAVFNGLPGWLFGVRMEDAGGTKLAIRRIFDYKLISTSPFFEAERLILAHREALRMDFVPIRFRSRAAGQEAGAGFKNLYTSLRDLVLCLKEYGFR